MLKDCGHKMSCLSLRVSPLFNDTSKQRNLIDLYGYLLKKSSSSEQLNQIHTHMRTCGFFRNDYMIVNLVNHIFTTAGSDLASVVFKWIECPNGVLWTSMIRGYSCCGPYREAILFYAQMRRQCFFPNNFNLPFAFKSCAALKALLVAEQLHTDVVKLGYISDIYVQTALLDMYVKCGRVEVAKEVFDSMKFRNVVSWTAILAGYCSNGLLEQAQNIFDAMPIRNVVTWNVMIDGLARFGALKTAHSYFVRMPQRNTVSWTILIGGYSRAGDVEKARMIFDQMVEREVVAWTAMITCYVHNGYPEKAIELFHEMLAVDAKPDGITILAITSAVAQIQTLDPCAWIEDCIKEWGFQTDHRVLNAAINMYVQCGSVEKARIIFEKIPKKDVISYNSMITGYATHGDANQAFFLFSMMNQDNVLPNSITFIALLSLCAHRGLVEEGRKYFQLMLDMGYVELKSEHYACMADLLGRAGYLDEAHSLILDMPMKPEASTWGALLGACKIHGNLGLAKVVAQRLFKMEPGNSGNYTVLANMYTEKGMWDAAANLRKMMDDNSVFKTPGSSWAEV